MMKNPQDPAWLRCVGPGHLDWQEMPWSRGARARRQYQRQGLLVEPLALAAA